MRALMQDWSLTLDKIFDHAARWHGDREVVTRSVEGPVTRSDYATPHRRAKQVSRAHGDGDQAGRPDRHHGLELGPPPGGSGTAPSASARCCTR